MSVTKCGQFRDSLKYAPFDHLGSAPNHLQSRLLSPPGDLGEYFQLEEYIAQELDLDMDQQNNIHAVYGDF